MLLKGKQASDFCAKPKKNIWAVVAHSEDEGLVADAASTLIKSWTPKSGDLEVTSLDDDTLRKDPSSLFDHLEAVSLLGGDRCIRVRTSGDKSSKILIEALTAGDKDPQRFAARLIVQASSLQKRSKLRNVAEGAAQTACLHFFADGVADIKTIVTDTLNASNVTINEDALTLFVGHLPGHRSLANAEIEKLALYAHDLGRPISISDIRSLSATDIDHALSDAIRAVLAGHPERAHNALDRLEIAGTSPISILRSLQSEALRMLDAHAKMSAGNSNPGMNLRPPVWNSDWPAFSARLKKWPSGHLLRILERLYDAERQAKASSASSAPTVRMLMNDLVRAASRS